MDGLAVGWAGQVDESLEKTPYTEQNDPDTESRGH